jgi:hypothetical protein
VIEDGMIVNPYLKKRHMGKKIVKDNPVFKKDVMNASQVHVNKTRPSAEQSMGQSTAERFSQPHVVSGTDQFTAQLGKHGFLKHSNQNSANYHPPTKYIQNESLNISSKQDSEPYRREAGKSLQANQNQQSREMGSRNIKRKIVEDNILRNASAERSAADPNSSLRMNAHAHNNTFEPKSNHQLENRMQEFYQNQPHQQKNDFDPYQNVQGNVENQRYPQSDHQDQDQAEQEQQNQYMQDFYHQKDNNRDENTQTPEPQEERPSRRDTLQEHQVSRARERSLQPNNHAAKLTKSVNIQGHHEYPEYGSDTQSRANPSREKEVLEDVGEFETYNP